MWTKQQYFNFHGFSTTTFWHSVSVFVLWPIELWLGNRKHPIVLASSWSCGGQEVPYRSCSIVPAVQEESLHLLQLLVPPSPPFVLGQPWLCASLQVRTTKCSQAQHCSTSLMSVIDSPSTQLQSSLRASIRKKKKSQPRSKDEINGSQNSWNSAARGNFKVTWHQMSFTIYINRIICQLLNE